MLGSLHKLWPMRITEIYLHQVGKPDKIILDRTIAPYLDDPKHIAALGLMAAGFLFVLWIEKKGKVSKSAL